MNVKLSKTPPFTNPPNVIANGRATVQTTDLKFKHKKQSQTILTGDQKHTEKNRINKD
jgi:hypothetical protein